jgi:SEC-C motif-containing protein
MNEIKMKPCPCGKQQAYKVCCFPYITGSLNALNAEALMRSRYSAFVLCEWDYLLKTHRGHELDQTLKSDLQSQQVEWIKLTIHETKKGLPKDKVGYVKFTAEYIDSSGRHGAMTEYSRFVKKRKIWLYDGVEEV